MDWSQISVSPNETQSKGEEHSRYIFTVVLNFYNSPYMVLLFCPWQRGIWYSHHDTAHFHRLLDSMNDFLREACDPCGDGDLRSFCHNFGHLPLSGQCESRYPKTIRLTLKKREKTYVWLIPNRDKVSAWEKPKKSFYVIFKC